MSRDDLVEHATKEPLQHGDTVAVSYRFNDPRANEVGKIEGIYDDDYVVEFGDKRRFVFPAHRLDRLV